jgi:hypothetical protein
VDRYDEMHRSFVGSPSRREGLRFLRMIALEFASR